MAEPGLKMTKPRRFILEELHRVHHHPSAHEIYERVRQRLPRVSLGTVYRNLEKLSEAGLIRKLEVAGNQRRYDGETESHSHIRCVRCGRVDDLGAEPALRFSGSLERKSGYRITGQRLEVTGICPECQVRERPKSG